MEGSRDKAWLLGTSWARTGCKEPSKGAWREKMASAWNNCLPQPLAKDASLRATAQQRAKMMELNCIFLSWLSMCFSAVWPGHLPKRRRSLGAPPLNLNWPERPAQPLECRERGVSFWLGLLKCLPSACFPLGSPLRTQPPREATCRCLVHSHLCVQTLSHLGPGARCGRGEAIRRFQPCRGCHFQPAWSFQLTLRHLGQRGALPSMLWIPDPESTSRIKWLLFSATKFSGNLLQSNR